MGKKEINKITEDNQEIEFRDKFADLAGEYHTYFDNTEDMLEVIQDVLDDLE